MYSFLEIVDAHYYAGKHIVEAINGNNICIVIQQCTAITVFC